MSLNARTCAVPTDMLSQPSASVPARPVTAIEAELLALLESKGCICGTANVGYALWPDHEMQPSGAAIAASRVIGKLRVLGMILVSNVSGTVSHEISDLGKVALDAYRSSKIDPRQLSLID